MVPEVVPKTNPEPVMLKAFAPVSIIAAAERLFAPIPKERPEVPGVIVITAVDTAALAVWEELGLKRTMSDEVAA